MYAGYILLGSFSLVFDRSTLFLSLIPFLSPPGSEMYAGYSKVDEEMLAWRSIVVARKEPRRILVQSDTAIVNDEVVIRDYEDSTKGVCQSFAMKYQGHDVELEALWKAEQGFHAY